MNDLELNTSHDLLIEDGDLKLLNSEPKVARQTLEINLLFYKGEWFLDNTFGVPYLQEILRKTPSTFLADSIISEKALESYRIENLTEFSSRLTDERSYIIDRLAGITEDGEIISITNLEIG